MAEAWRGTAVSLTPLPLDRDSRAYRIAVSLAEAGFRSVVIEGRPSQSRFWDERIEVRSSGRHRAGLAPGSVLAPGRVRRAVASLRAGSLGSCGETLLYAGFRLDDWRRNCAAPRRRALPAGLYYLHSFEMHRAVAPLAARRGARIVYDAHDFYRGIDPPGSRPGFDRDRLRPFLDRIEERLVAEAEVVVTVSEGVAELMQHTFGRRPAVVRNCHDRRFDRRGVVDLRTRLGLGPSERLCVVVGNWKLGMAVAAAAAALARLPERFHLAFLGRGYEAVADALPNDLLGRRLHIGLALAPDEIVPAIRTADVGLVIYEPLSENYRHALPNGFFQIVAAGLPLVRAALPQIEAVIGRRTVGVRLSCLNADALAQAIARCERAGDTFRAEAAALARELSWEAESARLLALLGPPPACTPVASSFDREQICAASRAS